MCADFKLCTITHGLNLPKACPVARIPAFPWAGVTVFLCQCTMVNHVIDSKYIHAHTHAGQWAPCLVQLAEHLAWYPEGPGFKPNPSQQHIMCLLSFVFFPAIWHFETKLSTDLHQIPIGDY
jgi:hypothetical protein